MAFSYKCAVSQQSFPAYSVEPTEVVVLLPDPPGGPFCRDGLPVLPPAPRSAKVRATHWR